MRSQAATLIRPEAGREKGLLRRLDSPLTELKASAFPPAAAMPGTATRLPRRGSTSSQPGTAAPGVAPPVPPSSNPGLSSTATLAGASNAFRRRRNRATRVLTASCTAGSNVTRACVTAAPPSSRIARTPRAPTSMTEVADGCGGTRPTCEAASGGRATVSNCNSTRAGAATGLTSSTHVPVSSCSERTTSGGGTEFNGASGRSGNAANSRRVAEGDAGSVKAIAMSNTRSQSAIANASASAPSRSTPVATACIHHAPETLAEPNGPCGTTAFSETARGRSTSTAARRRAMAAAAETARLASANKPRSAAPTTPRTCGATKTTRG